MYVYESWEINTDLQYRIEKWPGFGHSELFFHSISPISKTSLLANNSKKIAKHHNKKAYRCHSKKRLILGHKSNCWFITIFMLISTQKASIDNMAFRPRAFARRSDRIIDYQHYFISARLPLRSRLTFTFGNGFDHWQTIISTVFETICHLPISHFCNLYTLFRLCYTTVNSKGNHGLCNIYTSMIESKTN